MSDTIPKEIGELLQELVEHLRILREDLTALSQGKRYRKRSVLGQLRLLVCEKSKNNRGLLLELVKMFKYKGLIKTKQGELVTLENLFNFVTFRVQTGTEEETETLGDLIRKAAQEDGTSHAPLKRSRLNHLAQAVLEMGRSEKTDPYVGIYSDVAYRVLEYGEEFVETLKRK